MSVSGELLCSFELLKPLDSAALKQQMKKGRSQRNSMMHQSPVRTIPKSQIPPNANKHSIAGKHGRSKLLSIIISINYNYWVKSSSVRNE